jgi:arginase
MINILGIPFDENSSFLKGPSLAPSRIRQMEKDGSANAFSELGLKILKGSTHNDFGDIFFEDADPAKAFLKIKSRLADLPSDDKIFCFGGDHSITFPIIDFLTEKYDNLHILHMDAHADLYENFDDNPYSHASPFARILEKGKINSLTQVGIRTLTDDQRMQAKRFGVKVIEMKEFDPMFINLLQSPLYLSLDLDALDPAFAPGVSHHEPGGLSTRQMIEIIQGLPSILVGADIVEYNPLRDINNMTAMVAYKLFKEIIAKMSAG